jgi:uncharacterized protein
MDLNRDDPPSGPIVTGFSGRGFRIRDTVFPGGLLLTPEIALPWEDCPSVEGLTPAALGTLCDLDTAPEFMLLGTGSGLVQPPRAFVRAMEARGIGVDVMDSRAAARAWGVLRAEQRWIVAALMPL